MIEKTFTFEEPQHITLTGHTSLGKKKVSRSDIIEVTVKRRKHSVGFSWKTTSGKEGSISYSDHDVDITPPRIRNWFETVDL